MSRALRSSLIILVTGAVRQASRTMPFAGPAPDRTMLVVGLVLYAISAREPDARGER